MLFNCLVILTLAFTSSCFHYVVYLLLSNIILNHLFFVLRYCLRFAFCGLATAIDVTSVVVLTKGLTKGRAVTSVEVLTALFIASLNCCCKIT